MAVLRSVLALVEEPEGPVLADYPVEAPKLGMDEGPWACPLPLPAPPPPSSAAEELLRRLTDEIGLLQPWYDESLRKSGRTDVGLSGLNGGEADQMALTLASFAAGESPEPPAGARAPMPVLLRFLVDDLKSYYFAAALAQPGAAKPDSAALYGWLFRETVFGDTVYRVRDRLIESGDKALIAVARSMVPMAHEKRPVRA